jgi:hypothetical protein
MNSAISAALEIIIVLHAPPCPDRVIIFQIVIRGYACFFMIYFQVAIFMITTTYGGLSCTRHTRIKSTHLIIMNGIIIFLF